MRCEQASELMSLRLDRLPHAADLLDDHLAECPHCQAQWSSLQAVNRLFAHPPLLLPPPDFTLRVMARLEARRVVATHPGRTLFGWLIVLLGVAVFGGLLLAPVVAGLWGELNAGTWAGWAVGAQDTGWRLVMFVQALSVTLSSVAIRLLTAIPLPWLVGYAMLALTLVAAWVIVVGSLQLRHSEQTI